MPKWVVPKASPAVDPYANKKVSETLRATAKKKPAAVSKKQKQKKGDEKDESVAPKKHGQSSYGKAKEEFRAAWSGAKYGKDFEEAWKNSYECQWAPRAMPWSEIKKRKLDHLWWDYVAQ